MGVRKGKSGEEGGNTGNDVTLTLSLENSFLPSFRTAHLERKLALDLGKLSELVNRLLSESSLEQLL